MTLVPLTRVIFRVRDAIAMNGKSTKKRIRIPKIRMAKVINNSKRHIDCRCGVTVEYDICEPVIIEREGLIWDNSIGDHKIGWVQVEKQIECPACGRKIVTKKY